MRIVVFAEAAAWLALLATAVTMLLFTTGCGVSSDRTTQKVEREKIIAGPVTLDTPIGQFVLQPAVIERQQMTDEVERTDKQYHAPEAGMIIGAAASATPWGGLLTGVVGLATAAFAGKRALDNGRQRNELIDGIEKAKSGLGDEAWGHLTGHLEKSQNDDTKKAVKARVG